MTIDENCENFDTSYKIWEVYKRIYKWSKYWDFENQKNNPDKGRKFAKLNKEGYEYYKIDKEAEKIQISGDIIFNFKSVAYQKCKKILETGLKTASESDKEKIKNHIKKLEYCEKNHFSKENCSLLISTGRLQQLKNNIGNDRGDTFMWALNQYFIGKSELILNESTAENVYYLRQFLNSFIDKGNPSESIYKYCEDFYNIDNRDFINRLIYSGSKTIDTVDRVCEYINFVLDFWKLRKVHLDGKKRMKIKRKRNIPIRIIININC